MAAIARVPDPAADDEPRDRRPGVDSERLAEAIGQLGSMLDARFAQVDRQVTSVLRLLSHAAPSVLPETTRAGNAPVAISCLGPFQFRNHGTIVESWRSSKARSLFQYLVNHRGRPIPRDTLIQALWPNPDAVAAGTSLKVAVHSLRQALGQAGVDQSQLTVLAHDCGYQLNAAHLWIDVEEFDRCYALGRACESQGRAGRALVFYSRAADLYRGDFLEECTDDWPMFRREALKDQYLFVLTGLARASAAGRDYQGGIVRCQQLLAKDRCREDAYRLLMICHARLGQRSRVRTWYELCVQTLRAELDCGPEPETERVFRLALAGKV
ncbi:MAG: AfsR/SARP family transcriptional regulator [Chloroflexota bacterium]